MADVWSRLGIKPYEADPSKVKLKLEDMKPPPALVRTPRTLPQDTVFSQDGFIPDALRTMGDTGLNYLNLGAAGINALGGEIDQTLFVDAINAVRGEQEKSDTRTLSPMRKAETDKIKAQMSSAKGVVDNVIAGGNAGLDMLMHPIENSGKIVGGLADPTNFIPGIAGAKIATKLGGGVLSRVGAGAAAGAVSNAPINAIEEGTFAAARGEDWKKSTAAGFGGGAVGGAMIGGVTGGLSRPSISQPQIDPNEYISNIMSQWANGKKGEVVPFSEGEKLDPNGQIGTTRSLPYNPLDNGVEDPALLTHESQNQIPYSNEIKQITHNGTIIAGNPGWSEPLGNRIQEAIDARRGNDITDHINGIIDTEVIDRMATHVTQWADSRELVVREESVQAQEQITQMLGSGMDRQAIATTLDNMITPTRDDIAISQLLNNGAPLPSRLSGIRPIMMLENSIKTAIENPTIARTNKEFYEVLVAQGVDKPLANVMTGAYAAKDPSMLRDHIYQTLTANAPKLIDATPFREEAQAKAAEVVRVNEEQMAAEILLNTPKTILEDTKTVLKQPKKPLNDQAQAIKDASEIPVGGSEDATKAAVQAAFQKQPDSQYKNLSAKDRAEMDQAYANVPEDLYGKAMATTNEVLGNDAGSANMALIDARAKAMGITSDELMQRTGMTIENKTDQEGAQYVKDMEEANAMFQKSDVVNELNRQALRMNHEGDVLSLAMDFNSPIKTPLFETKISLDKLLNHIAEKDDFERRIEYVNLIKPTLEKPLFITHENGRYRFFKTFIDDNDKTTKFLTVIEDDNGEFIGITMTPLKNTDVRNLLKGDLVWGGDTLSAISTPQRPNKGRSLDESVHQKNIDVKLPEEVINGMVDLGFKSTGEMRSTISLFSTADVSTLPHELMHVFERTLDKDERSAFDHAFREYAAGEDRSEAGARGFEAYLGEGKAPTKELQAVFDKFKTWLRDLWEMVFHTPENGFKLNDSQRAFYRAMMGDKEAIKEVFGDMTAAPIEKDMIAAKILDDMPEAATVTKGENTQGGLFGADDGIIQQPKLFSDKVEVDTLKVPDGIKATPQEYRTTVREMAKGESLSYPMVADQIKRSKSYVEAKEEAIVKGQGDSLFGDDPKTETVLEDVGAKIGGARKDDWANRGITVKDLEAMSGGEAAKYATKDNVLGKADYAKMVEDGADPRRVAIYKVVRDSMAAKPGKDTPKDRADYVEMMGVARTVLSEFVNEIIGYDKINDRAMKKIGLDRFADGTMEQKNKFWSIYKGRTSPLNVTHRELIKADSLIKKGFPIIEPYRKIYTAIATGKNDAGEFEYALRAADRYIRGDDGIIMKFASKDEAHVKAKELYEGRKASGDKTLTEPKRPHLENIERTGEDVRGGKDTGADDFMRQYGFRGVEFGNWAAKDERQKIINHAYDGLNDLARVLNIPDKAVSLNGTLGMAFGSRGKGSAAAHYEPSKIVINMTKLSGAGSMAHEWGHALDHYFGELDHDNAYDGAGKYTTGGRGDVVDRSNLRPEMKEAFAGVMQAIFKSDANRAEVIRKYELILEEAIAMESKSTKPGSYSRVPWAQKKLNDLINGDARDGASSSYYTNAKQLNGKSGEYWTRPTELFARAFEAYVFDKLNTDFKRSDYLVQGVEGERYATGFKGNPYPNGLERQSINLAFDALFKTIKQESMSDGNIRLFQTKKIADGLKKMMEDC